jgi:hypothetical protein
LEQLTSLVEQLLPALQKNNSDANLVNLAQVVLARYDEQLIQAGNQKKVNSQEGGRACLTERTNRLSCV